MNAILAVALLAVCASAQVFDQTTNLNKYLLKSRFDNRDVFRSTGLLDKRFNLLNNKLSSFSDVYPRSYDYNNVDTTIYTLDEIVRQPLFQQYLTLPLFRQQLSNRLFQYYLTTPLFQKYWTIPQFQTLFTNTNLFYKYIYPVVYNTQSTSSIYDQVNVDSLYPVDRQIVDVDRYLNNGVVDKDVLSRYENVLPVDDLLEKIKYNKINNFPIYGREFVNHHHLPYTTVMDKIFKKFLVNKPVVEVITDVKVLNNKVNRQVRDYKIVDGQIVPVVGDRNVIVNDVIVKRPVDRTIEDLIRKPIVDDIYRRPVVDDIYRRPIVDDIYRRPIVDDILRRPVDRTIVDDLFVRRPIVDDLFVNGKNFNVKDAILRRLVLNQDKLINGVDNLENIDEVLRTPVDSELVREYKKDLLNNIEFPVTKTVV